jgi:hypothetical protein
MTERKHLRGRHLLAIDETNTRCAQSSSASAAKSDTNGCVCFATVATLPTDFYG